MRLPISIVTGSQKGNLLERKLSENFACLKVELVDEVDSPESAAAQQLTVAHDENVVVQREDTAIVPKIVATVAFVVALLHTDVGAQIRVVKVVNEHEGAVCQDRLVDVAQGDDGLFVRLMFSLVRSLTCSGRNS